MRRQDYERRDVRREQRLGIDIGRVLMCPADADGRPDTSFLSASEKTAMEVPAAPHMFEVVPRLVRLFEGRVYLVSKAGVRIEQLTLRWFDHHRFFERTGMRPEDVRFCRRREDKRVHAVELGLTHFIDDRSDVLGFLRGAVEHLFLFGAQTQPIPDWVHHVTDWPAVSVALSGDDQELRRNVLG